MDETFGLMTVIYLLCAAVALAAMFFLVRLAILSALAEDRRRVERAAKTTE